MSIKPLRKAVFPVAGQGTRFLPATKAMPKEMLPVVDRPLIQYAVDEARDAGIEEFIFVTGRAKSAIEDHFDRSVELERSLEKQGKLDALAAVMEGVLEPGRISSPEAAMKICNSSVAPMPLTIAMPVASNQSCHIGSGRCSPADTHSRSDDTSNSGTWPPIGIYNMWID